MKIGMVGKFPEQEDGIAMYSESLCEEIEEIGIGVVRIGDHLSTKADYKTDFNSLFLKSQLKKIIEKEMLDLLHIQYIAPHFSKALLNLNLILALRQNVPVAVTLHEVHATAGSIREKALAFIQKLIVKKADAVIAHTRQQKEFIQLKYKKKKAFHIHHGLALNPVHKLRNKSILLFGMLNHGKGAEYLIRAMNHLTDYKLTVAGKAISPEYEKIIRQAAAENKLGNVKLEIRWIPDEEKKRMLYEADIMAFPYVWAPYQSGTMHNAFSYGIPVVATDAGALGEAVKEYICGRVVEQRSPKALAAGIRAVHGNYETYQRGVLKYRAEANWKKIAEKHGEAYNETIQEHYETHGLPEKERVEKERLGAEMAKEEADSYDA